MVSKRYNSEDKQVALDGFSRNTKEVRLRLFAQRVASSWRSDGSRHVLEQLHV
jgi:hypothetical protein